MPHFSLLFLGKTREGAGTPSQAEFDRWSAFMAGLYERNAVIDRGHPIEPSGKVVDSQRAVSSIPTDAVFARGYVVVEADDIDAAAELAKGCPILMTGGSVEVQPLMVLPG